MEPNLNPKYKDLLRENAELDKQIADFKSRGITTDVQPQIEALHSYNEMKDLARIVLGYLANVEGLSITELHERYNLPLD